MGLISLAVFRVFYFKLSLSVSVGGTVLCLKRVTSSTVLAVRRDCSGIAAVWCSGSSLMDLEAEVKTGGCNVTNK